MKSISAIKPGTVAALALALCGPVFCATEKPKTLPTLTTIGQVRALSPQQAQQGYPVRVRAVVTFYHVAPDRGKVRPGMGLDSNMFVQDRTGGNWVGPAIGQPALNVGDLIELQGTTTQTDFAPDIVNPRWRVLGSAPMPRPTKSEFGRLASTREDSSWVEVKGIIRSVEPINGDLRLEIAMDGGHVAGYVPGSHRPVPSRLIDAEVRIRGICGAIFGEKNQVRGVNLFIPALENIQILESGMADPFATPVQTMSSILRFRVVGTAGHRVRIHGTVSLQRAGQYAYVQGQDGSTRVESSQTISLRAGDVVDAVGFPLIGEYAPILQEAVFRVVGHTAPPIPSRVKMNQLTGGNRDGDLVQINAELLDRTLTPDEQILVAESGGAIIQAQLEDPKAVNPLQSIERGSRLRLEGICTTGTDHKGGAGAIRLLLRTPADIQVLSRPSWLTFRHALWIVTGLTIVILAIVSWLAILRRKINQQTQIMRGRLESEAALEHRYRQLFERNLAGVYRMKSDGRLLDLNDACAQMLGYSDRDELLHLEPGNGLELSAAIIALVTGNDKSASSELCLRRKDGREMWGLVNATLLEEGRDSAIEGTIIEITQLKQTVKVLEERTTQLSALLENNPLAIAVMDSDKRIVMCNPAFERLFLFEPAEVIGKQIGKCILPPELTEEAERHFALLDAGQIVFRTTRRMRKDSVRVDVEAYGVPLVVEGRVSGCFGIYLDIHDRVAAETELRRMKEAAEAANRAKSAFLANISHEIRTPLSGVLMAADLAAAENTTPSQKEYLDIIIACGKSLQLLLNDVLDLSKIEAGKMELQVSNFSIRECLNDCIRLMGNNARQKGLDLSLIVDDDVPDMVSGDALRLRQIVLNLVGNSIKFTERGSVMVSARRNRRGDRRLSVEFSIKDTGIGIPPEKHSAVFREFEQAEDTTSRIFGGTGLGLAISNKLAGLMGGRMWLESAVNQGSVFHFTAIFEPATIAQRIEEETEAGGSGQTLRFLIAEDNVVNRHLAVRQLEKRGHLVTAVSDGRKAVETSAEHIFDVILMDVHMPEMDGIEATRQIRQRERMTGLHIPIIALTAGAMKQDRDACLQAGMDSYVSKPINPGELLSTVSSVLKSGGADPAAKSEDADLASAPRA
jgi:PAS domain S-box-containing protein